MAKLAVHKFLCALQSDVHVTINRLEFSFAKVSISRNESFGNSHTLVDNSRVQLNHHRSSDNLSQETRRVTSFRSSVLHCTGCSSIQRNTQEQGRTRFAAYLLEELKKVNGMSCSADGVFRPQKSKPRIECRHLITLVLRLATEVNSPLRRASLPDQFTSKPSVPTRGQPVLPDRQKGGKTPPPSILDQAAATDAPPLPRKDKWVRLHPMLSTRHIEHARN